MLEVGVWEGTDAVARRKRDWNLGENETHLFLHPDEGYRVVVMTTLQIECS